jgi:hypothetical protein
MKLADLAALLCANDTLTVLATTGISGAAASLHVRRSSHPCPPQRAKTV